MTASCKQGAPLKRRQMLQHSPYWMMGLGLFLSSCGDRLDLDAPWTMQLSSTAFNAADSIPAKYTCDGANSSLPLTWSEPPSGTRSFVVLMTDPDAPGRTFLHWIIYDLPPDLRQLPENLPPQPLLYQGGVQGKNDFGNYGYGGPCPPSGSHRYWIRLYALDRLLDLPPGSSTAEVIAAMKDRSLAGAELMGRYARP